MTKINVARPKPFTQDQVLDDRASRFTQNIANANRRFDMRQSKDFVRVTVDNKLSLVGVLISITMR